MKHNVNLFYELFGVLDWRAFVTGSYLVTPDTANDIDIVTKWNENVHAKLIGLGAINTNIKGYKGRAKTLESTWRLDVYNILVVKDDVAYALWKAFSNIITHKDYAFVNKADRIQLADFILEAYKGNN